jgi:hypothetical protein
MSALLAGCKDRFASAAKRAVVEFRDDRCPQYGAAIAYHVLFSLFPVAILLAGIFGIIVRATGTRADVVDSMVQFMFFVYLSSLAFLLGGELASEWPKVREPRHALARRRLAASRASTGRRQNGSTGSARPICAGNATRVRVSERNLDQRRLPARRPREPPRRPRRRNGRSPPLDE